MGAACCGDKYLVPQSRGPVAEYLHKSDVECQDGESMVAEAGEDVQPAACKSQAEPRIAQAWGTDGSTGLAPVTAAPVGNKADLVHFRPLQSNRRPPVGQGAVENIEPWVLGTMALRDSRRPAPNQEQLLQIENLKKALSSDSDSQTISQILKYNNIHSWVIQVPFRLEPVLMPDIDWKSCTQDDADQDDDVWFRSVPPPEGSSLTDGTLAEHNAKLLQSEKSKLFDMVSQTKANMLLQKSARIMALMEAMAAAIDPSLSSLCNTRKDDCVFSSVLSSENPGARCSSRGSEGRRPRRPPTSRSSSQSGSKDSDPRPAPPRNASFPSPGKLDNLHPGSLLKQRPRRHQRASFDREREDSECAMFLVCDDNDVNCQIVSCILSKLCPCKCVITHDGFQAVDTFSAHPPNYFYAIFMDIHMPECDGVTATRMIRDREKQAALAAGGSARAHTKTPIIGITADSDARVQAQCLEAGTNRVLLKPTKKADVRDALEQFGVMKRLQRQTPLEVLDVP